jgi:hypothetical protein
MARLNGCVVVIQLAGMNIEMTKTDLAIVIELLKTEMSRPDGGFKNVSGSVLEKLQPQFDSHKTPIIG